MKAVIVKLSLNYIPQLMCVIKSCQGTGIKQGWSWLPCPACQPSRLTKVNLLCIKEALVEKVLCDSGTATLCPVSR
ncbi:hypothetical protein R3I94_014324 [Phoxinus phoxinus]